MTDRSDRAGGDGVHTIIQDLYDSEINFSIITFWDGGFKVRLGDDMNGFVASGTAERFSYAVEWLMVRAIEKYPDSNFAKTYRDRTTPMRNVPGGVAEYEHYQAKLAPPQPAPDALREALRPNAGGSISGDAEFLANTATPFACPDCGKDIGDTSEPHARDCSRRPRPADLFNAATEERTSPVNKLDAKFYGQIRKVKDDSIVPDDEYVVFLVKDNAFAKTLPVYRMVCVELGADAEQIAAVDRMIERAQAWRKANPGRLKVPDAKGEKLLDANPGCNDPPEA